MIYVNKLLSFKLVVTNTNGFLKSERMNSTNFTFEYNDTSNQLLSCNNCLHAFLLKTRPELIQMIPTHWLQQDHMSYDIQILVGIVFFIICAPANIGHLLVFATYAR